MNRSAILIALLLTAGIALAAGGSIMVKSPSPQPAGGGAPAVGDLDLDGYDLVLDEDGDSLLRNSRGSGGADDELHWYLEAVEEMALAADSLTLGEPGGGDNYVITINGDSATSTWTHNHTTGVLTYSDDITASLFTGPLTGEATTAAALAANGANCAAGEIPLGVDTAGAAESCYEPVEADITDLVHLATAITDGLIIEPDLAEDSGTPTDGDVLTYHPAGTKFNWEAQSTLAAGTAAALASDPADCGANTAAVSIVANGDLTCAQLDHGAALTGLGDDDHSIYLLVDGTRAMSGDIEFGAAGQGSNYVATFQGSGATSTLTHSYTTGVLTYSDDVSVQALTVAGTSTLNDLVTIAVVDADTEAGLTCSASADTDSDDVYAIKTTIDTGTGTATTTRIAYGLHQSISNETDYGSAAAGAYGVWNEFGDCSGTSTATAGVYNSMQSGASIASEFIGLENYIDASTYAASTWIYGVETKILMEAGDTVGASGGQVGARSYLDHLVAENGTLYGFMADLITEDGDVAYGYYISDGSGASTGGTRYGVYFDDDDAHGTTWGLYDNAGVAHYLKGSLNVDGAVTLDGDVTLGSAAAQTVISKGSTLTVSDGTAVDVSFCADASANDSCLVFDESANTWEFDSPLVIGDIDATGTPLTISGTTIHHGDHSQYGEMHAFENASATTITSSDTWYHVTSGVIQGELRGWSYASGTLTASADSGGMYLLNGSISMSSGGGADVVAFTAFLDGVTQTHCHATRKLSANGDDLELHVMNETDTDDPTLEDWNVSVIQL